MKPLEGLYLCDEPKTETMTQESKSFHVSKLFELVQIHKWFSLTWVSEEGELITVDDCRCTSFHSEGKTMNIKASHWEKPVKVNRLTVTAFNGKEVYA